MILWERGGKISYLLYAPQLFLDLRLHSLVIQYGTCWLLLRHHALLLSSLKLPFQEICLKSFEDPSQIVPEKALIFLLLALIQVFSSHVGSQLSTLLDFVSGIWVVHFGKF